MVGVPAKIHEPQQRDQIPSRRSPAMPIGELRDITFTLARYQLIVGTNFSSS